MSLETISFNIPKKPASEVLKSFLDLVTEIFPDKRIVSFQIDSAVNPNHAYISNSSQLMSASDLLANEKILSALEFFKSHTFIDIKTIIVNSNVCFK